MTFYRLTFEDQGVRVVGLHSTWNRLLEILKAKSLQTIKRPSNDWFGLKGMCSLKVVNMRNKYHFSTCLDSLYFVFCHIVCNFVNFQLIAKISYSSKFIEIALIVVVKFCSRKIIKRVGTLHTSMQNNQFCFRMPCQTFPQKM